MSLKTIPTAVTPEDFIASIQNEQMRADCTTLQALFERVTGEKGKMWGSSIVGYGTYSYTRSDNKFYDYLAVGFSPRKTNLTIYIITGFSAYEDAMKKLGTYKNGKSCLYVKKLSDIHLNILESIVKEGYHFIANKHLDYKTGVWTDNV